MVNSRHHRQLKELRTKLAKSLVQVDRIRAGKLRQRTLTEAIHAAMSKTV